eukprot:scaffold136558_cov20-Tisochrysis_lutea.AAC.3
MGLSGLGLAIQVNQGHAEPAERRLSVLAWLEAPCCRVTRGKGLSQNSCCLGSCMMQLHMGDPGQQLLAWSSSQDKKAISQNA